MPSTACRGLLGRGSGTVIGGRAGLAVDPSLLAELARHRRVALVTGTNGKTTTTGMLVAALTGDDGGGGSVATNQTGSNMPAGHVAALIGARHADTAVLEVDEGYLGRLIEEARPAVVVLLNLSRDQLDRIAEVRMLVDRWRLALGALAGSGATAGGGADGAPPVVVANADDPMVAWAAMPAPDVRWVGAGQVWREDAVGCPSCGGRIEFDDDGGWHCDSCAFARPERTAWLEGGDLVLADGARHPLAIGLPGQFNRANAAMVAVAAPADAAAPGRPPVTVATALSGPSAPRRGGGAVLHRPPPRQGRAAAAGQEPGRVDGHLRPAGGVGPRFCRWCCRSTPGWPTATTRAGSGTSPSSAWPDGRWSPPASAAATWRCASTTPRWTTSPWRTRWPPWTPPPGPSGPRTVRTAVPPVEFLGNYTAFATLRGRL